MSKMKRYQLTPETAGSRFARRGRSSENAMRNLVLTFLTPLFVVVATFTMTVYPTPGDLLASITPPAEPSPPAETGGSIAPTVIENSLERLAEHSASAAIPAPADCFENLAAADQRKLDRCAVEVYRTIIDLERAERNGLKLPSSIQQASGTSIVPQLKLAAAEVCRQKWSKQPIGAFSFDSPACLAADVNLASDP